MSRAIRAFLLLLVLSSCQPNTIKLGVALPLSGNAAERGQSILNAIVLAVDEVNQAGGIKGKKLELLVQDDRDLPTEAEQVAQKLIEARALAVIGHYSSDVTLKALPFYQQAQMPLISPSVTLTHVPQAGKIFFRTVGSNRSQAETAIQFFKQAEFKRMSVVHNGSLYAQDLAREIDQLASQRLKIKVELSQEQSDTALQLADQQPELIFYAGGYRSAALFLQQLREAGYVADFMGGNTLLDSEFVRLSGLRHISGVWMTALPRVPESAFESAYRQRFGEPGNFSISAYDAVHLCVLALQQADKLDAKSVLKALQSISVYRGLTGRIVPASGAKSAYALFSVSETGSFEKIKNFEPRGMNPGHLLGQKAQLKLKN